MRLNPYTIPNSKYLKNGKFKMKSAKTYKWFSQPMRTVTVQRYGEYQNIKYEAFNPGSRNHIKLWMKHDIGYEFPYFTEAGSAKVDVDSLKNMEHPSGKLLKSYLKTVKDQSQVGGDKGGWITHYNEKTHSIHGRVDTLGATTHRSTHCVPVDYMIKTIDGYKDFSDIRIGDWVHSYDVVRDEMVLSKIKEVTMYKTSTGTFSAGGTSFRCTGNHRWVTKDGLKTASEIQLEDILILER